MKNIYSRTHKNHKNTNVELLLILSTSVIFRQYGVSQSECKIDRPRPGLSRASPRPHKKALGTRLMNLIIKIIVLMKMEYSVFKVEENKDGRRNFLARAGLYKSWQCFCRMYLFSLFKNKGIL